MSIEILSVVVTARLPAAELDTQLRNFRRGKALPIPVPSGTHLKSAEHWPTGSADPDHPQIRIEFGK